MPIIDFEKEQEDREQFLKQKIAALPKDNILKKKFREKESGEDMDEISEKLFAPLLRELHEARKAFIEGIPFSKIMEDYKELIDVCVKIYAKDKQEISSTQKDINNEKQDEKIRKDGEKSEKESLGDRLSKALDLDEKNKGQIIKPEKD